MSSAYVKWGHVMRLWSQRRGKTVVTEAGQDWGLTTYLFCAIMGVRLRKDKLTELTKGVYNGNNCKIYQIG